VVRLEKYAGKLEVHAENMNLLRHSWGKKMFSCMSLYRLLATNTLMKVLIFVLF